MSILHRPEQDRVRSQPRVSAPDGPPASTEKTPAEMSATEHFLCDYAVVASVRAAPTAPADR
jgi:hypothetical protein